MTQHDLFAFLLDIKLYLGARKISRIRGGTLISKLLGLCVCLHTWMESTNWGGEFLTFIFAG